jgi:hypothetical protein
VAFGSGDLRKLLGGSGQRRQRHYDVAVPYAPTAKGKAAERAANRRPSHHYLYIGHASTTTGGFDPLGSVEDAAKYVSNLNLGGSPVGHSSNPVADLAKEEAQNAVEVAKANYGGTKPLVHIPNEKELRAAATITTPVSAGEVGKAASAIQAGEKAARDSGAAAKLADILKGGRVRGAIAKGAQKAEPDALAATRKAIAEKAGAAVRRVPAPLRTAGRIAGRATSLPVKHPFTAPFALQVPVAAVKGKPSDLLAPLEGKGAEASIASAAGHLAPILGEAASLPASVLPTAYLVGKAGVSAAQGNPKELDALKKQYLDTGLLPAVASGNPSEALKRLEEHPLYSLLEGSGAASVLGRGAGAIAREATGGRVGGLTRADLPVEGTSLSVSRRYSPDLIRQALQRGFDRTRGGQRIRPDTLRGRHALKEAANRFESGQEAIRKGHIHEDMQALKKTLPKKWGHIDRKSAEVVNLAVERIIRHPETFAQDLPKYKAMLDVASKELGPDGKPALDRHQLANNEALRKQIEAAEGLGPERVHSTVHAANAFIDLQGPILQEMVDLKLIDPQQAAHASAVSFGRVHMGGDYGVPKDKLPLIAEKISAERQLAAAYEKAVQEKQDPALIASLAEAHGKAVRAIANAEEKHSQHIDANGNPLSLERITAEMKRQGIEPPGFLSHRAPSAGDFYQPNFGGATLEKGARTGESVATGSQMGGIEALVRQLRRSRGLVDRAKAWNAAVTRFGIEVPGVTTWADAKRVLRDPQRYGLDPGTQPVAVPRYPFMAKKTEIQGALEHQSPEIAGESASKIVHGALDEALNGHLPENTPVVFFPGKVAEELRSGAAPAGGMLRGAQAATNLFTRTVLPFSPGWYLGNGLDNGIRTVLAGINPAHFLIGSKVKRELTPEQQAELLAGAHFSSQAALNPHRSVEAVIRGYDPLSKSIRAASEWSHRHGWKQTAVKFAPQLLSHSSDYLMAANAYITENLPQQGALGKLALAEMKDTQGSWTRALIHQREIAKDFANKAVDPNKMIQFQKDLETVYGNYTRMSPEARKFLRNISPFWTWFRAAYKFVYLTMPAHHPIATAALTAGSRATQPIRQQYGLDKEGERPVPSFMQGGIPLKGGGIFPTASYTSFGYAADPLEAVNRLAFPQYRGVLEALAGRDWKGDELKGGEGGKALGAIWTLATAFIPGAPLLAEESEGRKSLSPHLPKLPHAYDAGYVQYKRTPTQKITVPVSGSSSGSGSAPWKSSNSSSSETAPWKSSTSSSSGKAPWK